MRTMIGRSCHVKSNNGMPRYPDLIACAAFALVALPCCAAVGVAQTGPAGFSANVHVDSIRRRGDTLFVTHTATNAPSSPQPLWGFVLETPVAVAAQRTPASGDWFTNLGVFGGRQSAQWLGLGDAKVAPGHHTPPLSLGAIGIPDIVSYWIIAYTPPPQTDDPDGEPEVSPMLQRSIRGTTVGVAPLPQNATAASLTVRLRALLGRSCGELHWISQAGVCHSLDVKLIHAAEALDAGQTAAAREQLRAFMNELDAQHGPQPGKHVNDAAYALLEPNVSYILSKL